MLVAASSVHRNCLDKPFADGVAGAATVGEECMPRPNCWVLAGSGAAARPSLCRADRRPNRVENSMGTNRSTASRRLLTLLMSAEGDHDLGEAASSARSLNSVPRPQLLRRINGVDPATAATGGCLDANLPRAAVSSKRRSGSHCRNDGCKELGRAFAGRSAVGKLSPAPQAGDITARPNGRFLRQLRSRLADSGSLSATCEADLPSGKLRCNLAGGSAARQAPDFGSKIDDS